METTVGNIKDYPVYQNRSTTYYVGRSKQGKRHMLNTPIKKMGWLGNPFTGNRAEAIAEYKVAFLERIDKDPEFRSAVHGLRGMILTCQLPPKPCHADVIAEYLNSLPEGS